MSAKNNESLWKMSIKKHFVHNTDIGQNFLIDRSVVEYIVKRSAPTANDVVLEIGPGDGALTRALLQTEINKLFCVELDERLREKLEPISAKDSRCNLFWADALRFDYGSELPIVPTKVIANLPYHITTPLMWKFLEEIVVLGVSYFLVMVQLESAERIAQTAGGRSHSPLGVTIEAMGSASVLRKVPPQAFNPRPKVNSALIEIKIDKNRELPNNKVWRTLLHNSFAQRRKTLANNWAGTYKNISREKALDILQSYNLSSTARAEELSLDTWFALAADSNFSFAADEV